MSDLLLIVKAIHASNGNLRTDKKTGKKKNRRGTFITPLISGLFLALLFGFFIWTQNYGAVYEGYELTQELAELQTTWIFSFTILWSIFISGTQAIYLFYTCNNDQFLPLPISGGKLFLARLFLSFYISLCNSGLMYLGASIGLCISLGLGVGSYFVSILNAFLVSIIGASVSFVLISLLAMIASFKKNHIYSTAVTLIFSFLAGIALIIGFAMFPTPLYAEDGIDIYSVYSYFSFVTWMGYIPSKSALLFEVSDIQYIFYMILITAGVLFLAYLFGNFFYIKTLEGRGNKRKKTIGDKDMKKVEKVFALSTQHPVLFNLKKEWRTLRKHTGLLISAISSCLMIVLIVITIGTGGTMTLLDEGFSDSVVFMVIHITICSSLWFPHITYATVSLEGRNMIAYKAIPVDTKKMMGAKLLPGLILSSFMALILCIAYGVWLSMNPVAMIFMFLSCIAYSFLAVSVVLCIGTKFARFSYINQMEILNRGWGPFLISLVNLVLPVVIVFFDCMFMAFDVWYMMIAMTLEIITCLALGKVFFDLSVKVFNKKLEEDLNF